MQFPVDYTRLSPQQRRVVRTAYINQQGGKCTFCGEQLSNEPHVNVTSKPLNMDLFPKEFLKWPIHLDHDHYTDMTRGAVHAYCNGVLFQYFGG